MDQQGFMDLYRSVRGIQPMDSRITAFIFLLVIISLPSLLSYIPVALIISARMSKVPVTLGDIFRMRKKKVDINRAVKTAIKAKRNDIDYTLDRIVDDLIAKRNPDTYINPIIQEKQKINEIAQNQLDPLLANQIKNDESSFMKRIGTFLVCLLLFPFLPYRLWFYARREDLTIPMLSIMGMKIRRTDPRLIIDAMAYGQSHSLNIDMNIVEAHLLCGGDAQRLVEAIVDAQKRGIIVHHDRASRLLLQGYDVTSDVDLWKLGTKTKKNDWIYESNPE